MPRGPGEPANSLTSRRESHPRRAALIAATSIFFMVISHQTRALSSPPAAIAWSARGVVPRHARLYQPHALSWPPLPMAFSSDRSQRSSVAIWNEGFAMLNAGPPLR